MPGTSRNIEQSGRWDNGISLKILSQILVYQIFFNEFPALKLCP